MSSVAASEAGDVAAGGVEASSAGGKPWCSVDRDGADGIVEEPRPGAEDDSTWGSTGSGTGGGAGCGRGENEEDSTANIAAEEKKGIIT